MIDRHFKPYHKEKAKAIGHYLEYKHGMKHFWWPKMVIHTKCYEAKYKRQLRISLLPNVKSLDCQLVIFSILPCV